MRAKKKFFSPYLKWRHQFVVLFYQLRPPPLASLFLSLTLKYSFKLSFELGLNGQQGQVIGRRLSIGELCANKHNTKGNNNENTYNKFRLLQPIVGLNLLASGNAH